MQITISMTADDSFADPGHPMGVTQAAYEAITGALEHLGTDIGIAGSPS